MPLGTTAVASGWSADYIHPSFEAGHAGDTGGVVGPTRGGDAGWIRATAMRRLIPSVGGRGAGFPIPEGTK